MPLQRVVLKLTELRCIAQSEGSKGSEPYLWTTFFAYGADPRPFQNGPLAVITPIGDNFRTEFPNGIKAGSIVAVPPTIASEAFDLTIPTPLRNLLGVIVVLMEEDETPLDSIILGRNAYAKEIEVQLNELANARLMAGNFGSLTDSEISTIKTAVKAKVRSAIASNQFNPLRDQDDNIGFIYKSFSTSDITPQSFDFPESGVGSGDRYRLSGTLTIGPVPPTVIFCKAEGAALKAKKDQLAGLNNSVEALQTQLIHASPQEKAALVRQIQDMNATITQIEAQLPGLQAALDGCLSRHSGGSITNTSGAMGPV